MDDRPSLSARDYVESLHQNSRATLLYGKNNVLVQPVSTCWDIWAALWSRTVLWGMHQPWVAGSGAACFWCLPGCSQQLTLSPPLFLKARRHGGDPGIPVPSPDCRHHGIEVDSQPADEWLRGGSGLREEVTGSQCMLTQGGGEANIPVGSEVVSGIQCHQRAFPLTLQS